MSQPTGLFSVSRPRQTLGNIQNLSGIPVPNSAMKRASSSHDLRAPYTAQHARSTSISHSVQRPPQPVFQRSSSGSNVADVGMSTVRRSASNHIFASASTSRHSLAPANLFGPQTPASTEIQRRSSIYSRPSNNGPMPHQSFFTQAPGLATKPEDPRPVRDRAWQTRISQELLTYLTQNNFELEMKHSLSHKSVTSPTQKDFNNMFQWLYKRIDPGYRFQKSIDAEVPPILKQLRYPYEHKITRSQLQSVGGQNWSTFLALLHWMMQLAQMLDNYARGAYDDASADAGVDVASDRIVFRFLFGAYQDWVGGSEDDDESAEAALQPHIQAMAAEFERTNVKYADELKIYEAENAALKAQLEELEKGAPDVAKLDKHFHILEDDKKKFEEYNANVQAKIEKYDSRVKILDAEIQKTEVDLTAVEHDRATLQHALDRQGLNIQEIDRMNTERERLQKSTEDTLHLLEEVSKRVLDKEAETAKKLEDLEGIVKRYNSLAYQTSLIPATAAHAKGVEYELRLNLPDTTPASFSSSTSRRGPDIDRLLSSEHIGHSPGHLLSLNLKSTTRPALLSLRKEIHLRRTAAAESALNARDFLDNISDALSEKATELDSLNHRVHLASQAYAALKDTTSTTYTQSVSGIEKLEKELSRLREGVERGVLELEQREMEVAVAWEAVREEAGRVREHLHGEVERGLEEVVRFKVHVQRGLEEMEGWVCGEVESELLGGGGSGQGELPDEELVR